MGATMNHQQQIITPLEWKADEATVGLKCILMAKSSPLILLLLDHKTSCMDASLLIQCIITEKQSYQINIQWWNIEKDSWLTDSKSKCKPQVESQCMRGSRKFYQRGSNSDKFLLGSFVIFQGIRTSIAKKPYIFRFFWGVQTPCPPPSGSAHGVASIQH